MEEEKITYKLSFDNKEIFEINDVKDLRIYLAKWDGTANPPKYMTLWVKSKNIEKQRMKQLENLFYYNKLLGISIFTNDKITKVVPAPNPFQDIHYEEGDLMISMGDPLYADEV